MDIDDRLLTKKTYVDYDKQTFWQTTAQCIECFCRDVEKYRKNNNTTDVLHGSKIFKN
jgi:hypothetical protein